MTDHATWVSFTNDEMAQLLGYLEDARSLTEDEATNLAGRLNHYSSPAIKDQDYRAAAELIPFVRDGECEIDDHAVVSASDEGAYVMAWVWVYKPENEDD